jgi:hypothetical protein
MPVWTATATLKSLLERCIATSSTIHICQIRPGLPLAKGACAKMPLLYRHVLQLCLQHMDQRLTRVVTWHAKLLVLQHSIALGCMPCIHIPLKGSQGI